VYEGRNRETGSHQRLPVLARKNFLACCGKQIGEIDNANNGEIYNENLSVSVRTQFYSFRGNHERYDRRYDGVLKVAAPDFVLKYRVARVLPWK
jgi:hypothetical protein